MEKYKDSINHLQIEEKLAKSLYKYMETSIKTSRPPENREIINTFRYLSLDTNAPRYAKKDLYLLNFKDQKVEISRIKQVLQDFIEELPKIKRIHVDFKRFENYLQIVENFPELKGSLYLIELKPDKLHEFMKVYKDIEVPLYRLVDVIDKSRLVRIENLTTAASKLEKYENESDRYYKSMTLRELYVNMLDPNTLERYKEVLELDANILEKSKKELKLIKSVYKLSKN